MASTAQLLQVFMAGIAFDSVPASGYVVYFVDAGTAPSIASLKTIWLDYNKSQTAANPYTLDTDGRAKLYLDGVYDIIVKDVVGGTVKATWSNFQILPSAVTAEAITTDRRNASGGTVNVSVPAANSASAILKCIIKSVADTSANSVIITPDSGTIGGLPQWTLNNAGESALLIPIATDNDYLVK